MPQGARTLTFTISSTSISSTDFKAQIESPSMDDSRDEITIETVDVLRTYSIPGAYNGTFNFTIVPTTTGNTLVTSWNTAVKNGEEVTYVVDQVALGSESAAPSTDAPRWRLKGYPLNTIGGPTTAREKKMYEVSHSLSSVEYDVGGGYVPHNG